MKKFEHTKLVSGARKAIRLTVSVGIFLSALFTLTQGAVAQSTASTATSGQEMAPKDILKKAKDVASNASTIVRHSKTVTAKNHSITDTTHYLRNNPDGTMDERVETTMAFAAPGQAPSGATIQTVSLNNEQGHWLVIDSKKLAIQLKFIDTLVKNVNNDTGKATSDIIGGLDPSQCDFTVKNTNVNSIDCYEVTATVSDKLHGQIVDMFKSSAAMNAFLKGRAMPEVPAKIVIFIQKNTFLVYGQDTYTQSGDQIQSTRHDSVINGSPLADTLFKIPESYDIKVAENPSDLASLLRGVKQ